MQAYTYANIVQKLRLIYVDLINSKSNVYYEDDLFLETVPETIKLRAIGQYK